MTFLGDVAVDQVTGCWIWQGLRNNRGYALDRAGNLVHRLVYLDHAGPYPSDLELDHTCRIRACVRPAHLEPVTRSENERRKLWRRRAKQKRCPRGHRYDIHGRLTKAGGRVCLKCAPVGA